MQIKRVKFEIYLPEEVIETMRNQLNKQGLLTIGNYDQVISYSEEKGYWRPLLGADPINGEVGKLCHGTECKMEFSCEYIQLAKVKKIIESIHPYDEPVYNVIPLL